MASRHLPVALLLSFLQGLAQGPAFPAVAALLFAHFPSPAERARAWALVTVGANVGASVLPVLALGAAG